jgi:biotin synthase
VNEIFISDVLDKEKLSKEEIIFLLKLSEKEDLDKLFHKADEVRKKFIGEEVFVRGILEFSNFCKNDCLYCGIRLGNKGLNRYRIDVDEIVSIAENAVKNLGFKTVLLQSGEDDYYSAEVIEGLIKKILEKCDCRVALSLGERSVEEYKKFFSAGAKRCLIRFETSNKELFESLHPAGSATKNSFDERLLLIKKLKEVGYQVGTGPMIGLPGQTVSDLADDILLYEELGINMAGMGPYICHPETPLVGEKDGSFDMSLKMIAVTRLVCKDIFISATTALQTLNPSDGREKALQSGANLLMPNITPMKYREFYQLYPDKVCIYENPIDCAGCVTRVVRSVGRRMGDGYGDPKR